MRALQHRQKYQSSLACGSSVLLAELSLWRGELFVPVHPSMLLANAHAPAIHLTSHRSSTTLLVFFPPFRHASIGPLSDDNQHEAPISAPNAATSIPTNFARFHLLAVSASANLPTSRSGSHTVHLASKALAPACLFTMRPKHSPFLFPSPANHRTPSIASAGKFLLVPSILL